MSDQQVTIFIPVKHFRIEYLREALASVLGQSCPDWKLLFVVDGPEALQAVRSLTVPLSDSRIRIIPTEGRLLAGSYNTAMRHCDTDFIGVLLGDDAWVPEAVEVLGREIRAHPDVDFFHAGRYFVDGAGRRLSSDYLPRAEPVTAEAFLCGSPVKHLFCWRVRAGLACGGLDESLNNFASDDYDFPWTMHENGAVFRAIPSALYIVRDHRDGFRLTTHVPRSVQRREMRRIMAKHGATAAQIRRRVSSASRLFLRQSLFLNPLHRWLRERFGFDAQHGWREPYQ